jgi:triphosphatase
MAAQPGDGTEIEWQFEAQDLRPVLRWIERAAGTNSDARVTIKRGPTEVHVDTYLDTDDRRLDRAGYSVRLRRTKGAPVEATLKSLTAIGADALRVRLELAELLDEDEPSALTEAPGPVGQRVRALIGHRPLVPLFDLQTRRRVFPVSRAEVPSGELLLDETVIRDPAGQVLSRLRRVELEVPEAALDSIAPLVESLRTSCGLQPAALSKYEAGLAAAGIGRAELETFGPVAIDPGDRIGQVALATLRRHFARLVAKEPGTRLGDDVEELHDMRVASRRLRAAVALFRDFLPADAERLRPELAWVGGAIGAVRDLDVQIARLDGLAQELPDPDRDAVASLRDALVEMRRQAREEMLEALDSPRYERFLRRFGTMLRSRSGARTPLARAVAPGLIERRHRAVRKAARRVSADPQPDAYHRLRIAGKRLRYALEFLSDVYPGETGRVVRRTVALQDLLGAYQDASVGTSRLRDLAVERSGELGPQVVFAMGELAGIDQAAMRKLSAGVPRAYARLNGKVWKRLRNRMRAS